MATDPICHMTVDEKTGPHIDYKGQTYYFCSKHCLAKFAGRFGALRETNRARAC